jgi:oligopeptidase B
MTLTFPPTAKRLPRQFQIHGESIADDYFWLRDRDNPEVLAYLQAENQYTQEIMQPTRAHQELLYAEMRNRIKETDQSVPFS